MSEDVSLGTVVDGLAVVVVIVGCVEGIMVEPLDTRVVCIITLVGGDVVGNLRVGGVTVVNLECVISVIDESLVIVTVVNGTKVVNGMVVGVV